MSCTTDALSSKIVISICDGRRLGHICNYEIDVSCGSITAVFVPGEGGVLGFGRSPQLRIPWNKITKIGEDAVLVDVPPHAQDCTHCSPPKNKWFW